MKKQSRRIVIFSFCLFLAAIVFGLALIVEGDRTSVLLLGITCLLYGFSELLEGNGRLARILYVAFTVAWFSYLAFHYFRTRSTLDVVNLCCNLVLAFGYSFALFHKKEPGN
jgi:hypothetical protein